MNHCLIKLKIISQIITILHIHCACLAWAAELDSTKEITKDHPIKKLMSIDLSALTRHHQPAQLRISEPKSNYNPRPSNRLEIDLSILGNPQPLVYQSNGFKSEEIFDEDSFPRESRSREDFEEINTIVKNPYIVHDPEDNIVTQIPNWIPLKSHVHPGSPITWYSSLQKLSTGNDALSDFLNDMIYRRRYDHQSHPKFRINSEEQKDLLTVKRNLWISNIFNQPLRWKQTATRTQKARVENKKHRKVDFSSDWIASFLNQSKSTDNKNGFVLFENRWVSSGKELNPFTLKSKTSSQNEFNGQLTEENHKQQNSIKHSTRWSVPLLLGKNSDD